MLFIPPWLPHSPPIPTFRTLAYRSVHVKVRLKGHFRFKHCAILANKVQPDATDGLASGTIFYAGL